MLENVLDYEGLKYYDGKSKEYIEEKDNTTLEEAKTYTDTRVANLVGTAPETLNTLEELAEAIEEHQEVADLLTEAIGNKANKTDLDSHTKDTSIHITQEEKDNLATKESLNELEQTISELNATATATGSSILVTDSANGNAIDFKGKGRSTQDGEPTPDSPQAIKSVADGGYFDGELLQGSYSGTTGAYANTSNYVCNKNITPCKPNDVIKIISEDTMGQMAVFFYDESKNFLSVKTTTGSLTEYSATTPTNAYYFNWAVNKANITPTNAKPITVTINDEYALIVKIKGKNLLNCRGLSAKTSEGVTFTPVYDDNENLLYVNANGIATETALFQLPVNLENGQYIINGCSNGSTSTYGLATQVRVSNTSNTWYASYTGDAQFETSDTKVCTHCFIQVNKGVTVNNVKFYPMIRKAEVTDDTYEPYKETVTYIPLNESLRSIGKYSDVIKSNGVGRNTLQITYNGSESGWFRNTISGVYCFSIPRPTNAIKGSKALCTHYVNADTVTNNNAFTVGTSYINVRNDDITTVADWKAKLAENPITVIMPISEEEFEPFAEPVDIVTYDNVTYLTASDNAEMEIEYFRNSQDGQVLADVHTKLQSQINDKLSASNLVAGGNITLTNDGDKITISSTGGGGSTVGSLTDLGITATATELNYMDGVTSNVQTQLNGKVNAVSGKGLSTNDYTTTEKTKLAGIASGAEANQNAFSNVVVGSTTIAADTKTDTLTIVAGSNVTITPDATNDKITIAATDTVYTHPTTSGNKHIPAGGSSGQILRWSADGTAVWGSDNNTTYVAATQSAPGLMSADDKKKLDGIATGANAITVDSALSSTSTNPVQNKVINTALAGKANSSHGNHVPTVQTANNAIFLRNDNTWATVTPANIGAAAASHGTHVSYGTSASALGTSSAGTATTVSRSDHVHALPALTSCTGTLTVAKGGTGATDAATARTNLGLGTASTYAATTSITSGGTGLITSGAVYTGLSGKAPTAHAASALTYGGGTASNYGHVKLSDSYTSSAGAASASVAASSKAVADAYAAINSNLFKTADYEINLTQLNWIKTEAGKYYAYYSMSNLNITKVLSATMTDWGTLRETDNVVVGATDSNILISSNVNTFFASDAAVCVRVHYV